MCKHRLIIVRFSISIISNHINLFRDYIKNRFKSQDKTEKGKREITMFETTATDTDLVRNVLDTVKSNILSAIMVELGFKE